MIKKLYVAFSFLLLVFACQMLAAQATPSDHSTPLARELSLEVVPQDDIYLCAAGESALLNIILTNPGEENDQIRVQYRFSLDGLQTLEEGTLELHNGRGSISRTLDQPGFLRFDISCAIGSDTLRAACSCGFDLEEIKPVGELPEDFDRFWREARAELLRIPLDPILEKVVAVDSGDAERYKVSLACVNGSRVYGWLHLPEGEGPFPTVLSIPGSGIGRTGRYAGFTSAGIAVLAIEIHGLEPKNHEIIGAVQWMRPADDEINYFVELQKGILNGYHDFGIEDPYRYYHRRSIQTAIRALDYLHSREDVDSDNIIVFGGSQGGGLSLLLTAIDQRVDAVIATVPDFCNHSTKRKGSGPEVFRTLSYYDVSLAADLIKVPALIGVGFIDATCRPTGIYSAYNTLAGPKTIENFYTIGHGSPANWRTQTIDWIHSNIETQK